MYELHRLNIPHFGIATAITEMAQGYTRKLAHVASSCLNTARKWVMSTDRPFALLSAGSITHTHAVGQGVDTAQGEAELFVTARSLSIRPLSPTIPSEPSPDL